MRAIKILPLFVFLLLFISPVFADTLTIDYTYVMDDTMVANAGTTNYSAATILYLRTQHTPTEAFNAWYHAYIKFNISSIPAGATINSAYLSVDSLYNDYGTNRYVELYNVSNAWSEENTTWANKPANSVLQSNTTTNYTSGWKNFTVTNAVSSAYGESAGMVSMMIRDSVENDSSDAGKAHYMEFASKEYSTTSKREKLIIDYSFTDCVASCGACGCSPSGGCNTPSILGSYVDNTTPNTIRCVPYANCTGISLFTCPNGTLASQVTPYFNSTTYPTTPGASNVCDGCWFINMLTGWPPHWQNIRTNCPADPECNCYGIFCSGNIYQAENISDTPYTVAEWTAGCFNPTTGNWTPLYNSTCGTTTLNTLVNETCGDECTLTNNTPGITECPVNTTTTCHDANCLPVACPISSSTSGTSGAGQLALMLVGLFGITDVSLALAFFAIIASMAVGFILLYYTRDSEHAGQAFMFGALLPLVGFTLISWFPAWLMVILIVLSAYLMARSIGIGGG